MGLLHAMGNNHLVFMITHKCGTNDPDIRPSLSQIRDLDLGSWWLSFEHGTLLCYRQ